MCNEACAGKHAQRSMCTEECGERSVQLSMCTLIRTPGLQITTHSSQHMLIRLDQPDTHQTHFRPPTRPLDTKGLVNHTELIESAHARTCGFGCAHARTFESGACQTASSSIQPPLHMPPRSTRIAHMTPPRAPHMPPAHDPPKRARPDKMDERNVIAQTAKWPCQLIVHKRP